MGSSTVCIIVYGQNPLTNITIRGVHEDIDGLNASISNEIFTNSVHASNHNCLQICMSYLDPETEELFSNFCIRSDVIKLSQKAKNRL